MTTDVAYGVATHPGVVRELNEDAVVAAPPMFAVADGMGGHAAGEVASSLVVERLRSLLHDPIQPEDLLDAINAANQAIVDWVRDHPETAGMGTTLSGVCLGFVGGAPHWFVFNIGDSRVYRYAAGQITQLTTDHSEVQELVSLGEISRDEAREHPRRNIVTRSLGTEPAPVPDVWVRPVDAGEAYLVCSDGLLLELDECAITGVLASCADVQEAADALVKMTLAEGARDNVSVVVVSVPRLAVSDAAEVVTSPRRALEGIGE